jgi:CRP-like cAMP-binding protein
MVTKPMEQLKKLIQNKLGENPIGLEFVLSKFVELNFRKNSYILEREYHNTSAYFLVNGIVHYYTYKSNGELFTIDIYENNQWFTDLDSFLGERRSQNFIKCLTNTKVYAIDKMDFIKLEKEISGFAKMYMKILEDLYQITLERNKVLTTLNSLERIKWMIENKKFLYNNLSDKVISSYLNINKDVYSRLKNKL